MTDHPAPPPERECDLRIAAAAEIGFYVQEAGHVIACFVSRAELADWIEARLLEVTGEREREEIERRHYEAGQANVERFPNIAQRPRTEPRRRTRFFGGE